MLSPRPAPLWSMSMLCASVLMLSACGTTPTVAPARSFQAPGALLVPCPRPIPLSGDQNGSVGLREILTKHAEDMAAARICADRVDRWIEWWRGLPK